MTIVDVSLSRLALSTFEYKNRKNSNSESSLHKDAKFYRDINASSYTSVLLMWEYWNIFSSFCLP